MYKVIEKNTLYELVEKKSKFIANLIYVENKQEAEDRIKEFKKKYHDARHNCYAYRVIENDSVYEKSSDDGEPSGTAGAPMLNLLQKNNLVNCIVIVTRYFGGILLGTGGLVRAYSDSMLGAIQKASMVQIEKGIEFEVRIDYPNFQNFQYYAQKNNISIINIDYQEDITCNIVIKNDIKERFLNDVQNKKIDVTEIREIQEKYLKI